MKKRIFLGSAAALAAIAALPFLAGMSSREVHVFKSRSCGCCGDWVSHMKSAGFAVKVTDVNDTTAARKRLGMPEQFGSCHTATVDGYVLEGHVPSTEVKRLRASGVKAVGLAVPSMPIGAPGMEMGARIDPYQVLLIDHSHGATVYASYPK
jgi:hypothetical protein